jgi:ubiquinone/menaquinone biosynthesis C-methylase UbiE
MIKDLIFNWNLSNRDKFITEISKNIKNKKVLDVGAGSAPYRKYFESNNEYRTHDAIPLKSEQLRDGQGYSQIDIVSDISKIPLENESIDVILCTEVLEHVPFPINAIAEMSRLLKSGGLIILTAPLQSGLHQTPYHFYGGYTPFFYENFLEKNFKEINISSNGNSYDFLSQEIYRFVRRILSSNLFLFILMMPVMIISIFLLIFIRLFSLLKLFPKDEDFVIGYHVTAKKK